MSAECSPCRVESQIKLEHTDKREKLHPIILEVGDREERVRRMLVVQGQISNGGVGAMHRVGVVQIVRNVLGLIGSVLNHICFG